MLRYCSKICTYLFLSSCWVLLYLFISLFFSLLCFDCWYLLLLLVGLDVSNIGKLSTNLYHIIITTIFSLISFFTNPESKEQKRMVAKRKNASKHNSDIQNISFLLFYCFHAIEILK